MARCFLPQRCHARSRCWRLAIYLALSAGGGVQARERPWVALVSVQAPRILQRPLYGYFANFSESYNNSSREADAVATWAPAGDAKGCNASAWATFPARRPLIAIVRRGNCTFVAKARHAIAAGATALVVVWDSEDMFPMQGDNTSTEPLLDSFLAISVPKSAGDPILDWLGNHTESESMVLSISPYTPPFLDLSEIILVVFATALVAAGAFVATADLRPGSPLAPKNDEEVVELSKEMSIAFFFLGSCMLMVLYFFMRYMIYYILFSFCIGGAGCITAFGSAILPYVFPVLGRGIAGQSLNLGVSFGDCIAFVLGTTLVACWYAYRNTSSGWLFQDIIGANVLCMMQRTLRLPNVRIAVLLMSLMFFYDIFWVFISPLFFRKSVMVEVAQGAGVEEPMPMLFRMPSVSDPLGSERMLGFGDIILPGLYASYLLRHDTITKTSLRGGYFLPCLVGYAIGLIITMLVLLVMHRGQPALLYLVPLTLGPTLSLAMRRGDLANMWNGLPDAHEAVE